MSKRRANLQQRVAIFLKQYGRKKRPGQGEPNDRRYDRKLEHTIKRMDPGELDRVMRQEDEHDLAP